MENIKIGSEVRLMPNTVFLNNNKGTDSQAQSMVQFNDDIFVYSCLSSTNTELPLILLNVTTKEIIEEQNDINFNGELVSTSLKVFSNNIIVNVYIQFVTEYSLYIRIYSYSNETGLIIGALCFTLTEYGTGIFRYQEVDDLLIICNSYNEARINCNGLIIHDVNTITQSYSSSIPIPGLISTFQMEKKVIQVMYLDI